MGHVYNVALIFNAFPKSKYNLVSHGSKVFTQNAQTLKA